MCGMGKNKRNKQNHDKGLPEDFLSRLADIFGSSLSVNIQKTFVERPTTFRVNTIKATREEVLNGLQDDGFKVKKVLWYNDAFILQNKTKRELTESKLYSMGKIYIQSLASMIPPLALDPKPGEKVLDLTAAPGSKTSQIAALMKLAGELVANDNNKPRFFKLKHNLEALGVATPLPDPLLKGEGTSQNWLCKLRMEHGVGLCREYPAYFDKILLDSPCSAEARFIEGDIKTYGYWSERKIKEMAYKQRQLLLSAWTTLKPSGTLVYSTCTFSPEENEIQIDRLLERNPDAKMMEIDLPGINHALIVKEYKTKKINAEVVKKALRIMPDKEIEGFFVAKVVKSESL